MGFKSQSIFTGTFTNTTVSIVEAMGLSVISINPISGTVTLTSTGSVPGLTSGTITLTVGQPVLISADSGYTLDSITINSTSGGVFAILGK
jgi:hypothetical protein